MNSVSRSLGLVVAIGIAFLAFAESAQAQFVYRGRQPVMVAGYPGYHPYVGAYHPYGAVYHPSGIASTSGFFFHPGVAPGFFTPPNTTGFLDNNSALINFLLRQFLGGSGIPPFGGGGGGGGGPIPTELLTGLKEDVKALQKAVITKDNFAALLKDKDVKEALKSALDIEAAVGKAVDTKLKDALTNDPMVKASLQAAVKAALDNQPINEKAFTAALLKALNDTDVKAALKAAAKQ